LDAEKAGRVSGLDFMSILMSGMACGNSCSGVLGYSKSAHTTV
jgi:hypothetical protein